MIITGLLRQIADGHAAVMFIPKADDPESALVFRHRLGGNGAGPHLPLHQPDQLLCRPGGQKFSFPDHGVTAGDVLHIRDDVSGDQDDPVVGELRQQIAETHPFAGIKPSGGFIQNQNLRVVQQRLSDPHPALHPAGEPRNFPVADLQQRDLLQQFVDSLSALPLCHPFQGGHIDQIIFHCEFLRKTKLLRQIPEQRPIFLPQRADGNAVIQHLSGGGLKDSGDDPHERGLARAVGAQKPPDPRCQFEADIADGFLIFKPHGNLIDHQFHIKTPFHRYTKNIQTKGVSAPARSLYQRQKRRFFSY